MGISMSTLFGWATILGVVGFYTFLTRKRSVQLVKSDAQRQRQERLNPIKKEAKKETKETKGKRTQADGGSPKSKSKSKSKPKSTTVATALTAPSLATPSENTIDNDVASNREFARQLSNVKQGTKFASAKKEETRQKSVKQSHAEERLSSFNNGIESAPSSTTGVDADDDRSSAASPVLVATPGAGNVDDMLEKPTPGPSVLRLTLSEEKTPAKAKTAKPAPQLVETKKQRQNRKKAELAKAIREEDEKERKVKMEAQRRAARIAEGRAAKDGSAFMAAQAKSQPNVWTSNGTNGNGKPAGASTTNGFVTVQPLDTFDPNTQKEAASKPSAKSVDKAEDWIATLPSEEEQMELLRKEDEDSWNTVKPKSRKSKNKATTAESSENEKASAPVTKVEVTPAATATAPATASDKKRASKVFTQQSAFAALSNDAPEDDDEEKEWDV